MEIYKKLEEIFFGEHIDRLISLGANARFAHYTSAEVAISIIKNKEIWMRSASVMNDSSEFDYGFESLWEYCATNAFKDILKNISPSLLNSFERLSRGRFGVKREAVFLSCLSEHSPEEDAYGRLSMWRAYGGGNGVALVLNSSFLASETAQYGLTTSSVAYLDRGDFSEKFLQFAQRMQESESFLKSLDVNRVAYNLIRAARFSIMATKHPAFREEKEWRIIFENNSQPATFINEDIVSINGVPQIVKKLSLGDDLSRGIGVDLGSLLEGILIGPTKYPEQIRLAIVSTLKNAGLEHLIERVRCTNIPLVT